MKRLVALLVVFASPAFAADEPVTILRGSSAPPPPVVVQEVVEVREIVYLPDYYPGYFIAPVIRRHGPPHFRSMGAESGRK